MKTVKENSPYHREESVFVHTLMVCGEFDQRYSSLEDDYFIGLFACLFHDIGKPECCVRKESEKRGSYLSFAGHDVASSKLAIEIMNRYNFNEFDIIRIQWMIENHQVFWTVKSNEKKHQISEVFRNPGLGINYHCFKAFMLSDDFGRICEERDIDSIQYFKDFEQQFLHMR